MVKIAQRNIGQRGDPTEQMHRVGRGENVEEAGGLIARDIHAAGKQLKPGDQLAEQEQDAKSGGDAPKLFKSQRIATEKVLARALQGVAAGQQNRGIEQKDFWQAHRHPNPAHVHEHDKRRAQTKEKHQYRSHGEGDRRRVKALRRLPRPPVLVAVTAAIAASGRYFSSASTAAVVNNQLDVFGYGCAWHSFLSNGCCAKYGLVARHALA